MGIFCSVNSIPSGPPCQTNVRVSGYRERRRMQMNASGWKREEELECVKNEIQAFWFCKTCVKCGKRGWRVVYMCVCVHARVCVLQGWYPRWEGKCEAGDTSGHTHGFTWGRAHMHALTHTWLGEQSCSILLISLRVFPAQWFLCVIFPPLPLTKTKKLCKNNETRVSIASDCRGNFIFFLFFSLPKPSS